VRKAAPGKNGARWGGVFSMDDHRHATAAVLDQTEEEKFLTFTPSDEDLERAADGTPWAQTNTCVRRPAFQSNLSGRLWFRSRLTDRADTGFRSFSFPPESA
jgi:hypothetical protein